MEPSKTDLRLLLFIVFLFPIFTIAQDLSVRSPNGKVEARIRIGKTVSYSIYYNGSPVVPDSVVALTIRGHADIGANLRILNTDERKIDEVVTVPVPGKRRNLRNSCNEMEIGFQGNYGMIWRVYNGGVAYRWTTDLPGPITVSNERVDINLDPNDVLTYPEETDLFSHNEALYFNYKPKELKTKLGSLPLLISNPSGLKLWVSEADLYDYAGMWVQGNNGKGLKAVFPNYPSKESESSATDLKVAERADFIAQTTGKRQFPWRVFGLGEQDKQLLDNDLVYLLSEGTKEDFSWVRPGKVSWDWWNALTLYGVDFKSGVNFDSYKYFIDFASKYGLDYIIMDLGWSKPEDPLSVNPAVKLPELLDYAKSKNVKVILWVSWIPLNRNMEAILDRFQEWGVSGVKIDFMQRDDQKAVNFYERAAREAAKRKLIVDFHGSYKPTGLSRKYPNVLSYEGVRGLEHSKFDATVTPQHDVTFPFIRMAAGPLDYTPGAMLNSTRKTFSADADRPMSQGTRGHQLAMYVVYESPLQMLADSPSNYLREPESMEFLSAVPTVWDETLALDGKIGDYVVIARRSVDGEWYVGGMTNWTPRRLEIDLSFLDDGEYSAQIFQDGPNANRMAADLQKVLSTVRKGDKLSIDLAAGGGFAIRITKK
ncbi:MAG: glycoside hydrolase family 97 protein [Acidobacteriota bacterium]